MSQYSPNTHAPIIINEAAGRTSNHQGITGYRPNADAIDQAMLFTGQPQFEQDNGAAFVIESADGDNGKKYYDGANLDQPTPAHKPAAERTPFALQVSDDHSITEKALAKQFHDELLRPARRRVTTLRGLGALGVSSSTVFATLAADQLFRVTDQEFTPTAWGYIFATAATAGFGIISYLEGRTRNIHLEDVTARLAGLHPIKVLRRTNGSTHRLSEPD